MVSYRNHITNKFNVGIVSARDAGLYTICTEHGTHVSRNRIDLKRTDAPFEQKTETQPVSNFAKSKHAPTNYSNVTLSACYNHCMKFMTNNKIIVYILLSFRPIWLKATALCIGNCLR